MRADMSKVIVERPRRGGGPVKRGRALRGDDDAHGPVRLTRDILKPVKTKGLNENLAPLRRYLEAQVSRPWDKVWSEICAHLKPSSTVQQHVRDHVSDFIAVKTVLKDGDVWVKDGRRSGTMRPLNESYVRLYVDPKTGIIRRNTHWQRWKKKRQARLDAEVKERESRMRVLSRTRQLHLLADGAWWDVTLARVPCTTVLVNGRFGPYKRETEHPVDDVVLRARLSGLKREELYGGEGVYAAAKRQLSKKEKRAFGLP